MTTLCFIHQDKLAFFVFCQKDGIIISCLLNPPGSSTEALVKMTSVFLAQVSKSGISGWGKGRQWLVGFWKIDNMLETQLPCVSSGRIWQFWKAHVPCPLPPPLTCLFSWRTLRRALGSTLGCPQKNYWEVDFRPPWYFPMTLALDSYYGNGGEKILECDWRVLLFSTENNCGLLSAFPGPAGMKTEPNTFAKWHLSDL